MTRGRNPNLGSCIAVSSGYSNNINITKEYNMYDNENETIDFELSSKDILINWALVATLVAGLIYLGVTG